MPSPRPAPRRGNPSHISALIQRGCVMVVLLASDIGPLCLAGAECGDAVPGLHGEASGRPVNNRAIY